MTSCIWDLVIVSCTLYKMIWYEHGGAWQDDGYDVKSWCMSPWKTAQLIHKTFCRAHCYLIARCSVVGHRPVPCCCLYPTLGVWIVIVGLPCLTFFWLNLNSPKMNMTSRCTVYLFVLGVGFLFPERHQERYPTRIHQPAQSAQPERKEDQRDGWRRGEPWRSSVGWDLRGGAQISSMECHQCYNKKFPGGGGFQEIGTSF